MEEFFGVKPRPFCVTAGSQMRTMVLVYKNLQNWVIFRVNVGIHLPALMAGIFDLKKGGASHP